MIIGLDPDTRAIGFAVFRAPGELATCGILTSSKRSRHDRMYSLSIQTEIMAESVSEGETSIDFVVETSSSHQVSPGGGKGAANYGEAVGYILAKLDSIYSYGNVHRVSVDEWTKDRTIGSRRKSKQQRQREVRLRYPLGYLIPDPGAHASDAIDLVDWWTVEQKMIEISGAPKKDNRK
jgi:hypothetical protein